MTKQVLSGKAFISILDQTELYTNINRPYQIEFHTNILISTIFIRQSQYIDNSNKNTIAKVK